MLPAMPIRASLSLSLGLLLVVACAGDPAGDTGADDTGAGTSVGTTGDTGVTTGDAEVTTGASEPHVVPGFGNHFTVIGTAADGLNAVRDLAFNPGAPEQLWTFNMLSHGVVLFFDPGTTQQTAEVRIDAYGQHFMAFVSSAAFGDNGNFASCQESRDEWNVGPQAPDDFMGPTLWSSDLDIFAKVGQAFPPADMMEGSHLDMLHQSPLCMGIAHEVDNVYWAMDGKGGNVVRYDFQADHGPGGGDHSDGIITRYPEATLTRVANIPGHMELDHATGMLYIADTGGGRIMRLDTKTGTSTGPLPGEWDGAEYTGVKGVDYQIVVEGLDEPSGLALHEGHLLVSEHGSGDIIAFDLEGKEVDRMATPAKRIMGITIGPAGDLWYADAGANEVVRVDP
jgi:sugar lactone lactonase YvrE